MTAVRAPATCRPGNHASGRHMRGCPAFKPTRSTARSTCKRCGIDITDLRLRRDRQWCSRKCAIYYRREQRRVAARLARPRCIICNDPIRYGEWGVNLRSRTCGNRACATKLNNWFTRYEPKRGKTAA